MFERGVGVNAKDKNGNTPLHYACLYGNYDVITFLLKKKVCSHFLFHSDSTIILLFFFFFKIFFKSQDQIHQDTNNFHSFAHSFPLSSQGIHLNARNKDGETPLHCAVRSKKFEIIHFLVNYTGIDIHPLVYYYYYYYYHYKKKKRK